MKLSSRNTALFFHALLIFVLPHPSFAQYLENTDLRGQDINRILLPRADPEICEQHCRNTSNCLAWTYVKPNTTQGPQANCWLKDAVPRPSSDDCCISGVDLRAGGDDFEFDIDRLGRDYRSFTPLGGLEGCRAACSGDDGCLAWTWVKADNLCWFKGVLPAARSDDCCVSGTMVEWDKDRPGADYRRFIPTTPSPLECKRACVADGRCLAWTYVKPNTTQGPDPNCWLKSETPDMRKAVCCVSGTVRSSPVPVFPVVPVTGGSPVNGTCERQGEVCGPIHPKACFGRGEEWKVTGRIKCVSGESVCEAVVGRDFCKGGGTSASGLSCGGNAGSTCSQDLPCAPGLFCGTQRVGNRFLNLCRSLSEPQTSSNSIPCKRIQGFCHLPSEAGNSTLSCAN